MARAFNFNAGPAIMPEEVLKEAAKELVDYKGTGMSIMEVSHRSKMYEEVHNEAIKNIRELFKVPDNYDVLFVQGGASTQFAMVPMNLVHGDETADYIISGSWSEKALKEIKIQSKKANVVFNGKDSKFNSIPNEFKFNPNSKYVYLATNETIQGVQFKKLPETNGVPIVLDASSDIFSYYIDWKNVGLIYAGAQKNAGPSGVTIVIIRKDLYEREKENIPSMFRYSTHGKENSLYNTPPTFGVYFVGLTMKWIKNMGGINAVSERNEKKAKMIYDAIDNSGGYYKGHAAKECRSLMNVTFNLKTPELEEKMAKEGEKQGLIGIKGHRSVGGIRASIYNAMGIEGCEALVKFMNEFMKNNK
jgi:phosphoserine aminotransferase